MTCTGKNLKIVCVRFFGKIGRMNELQKPFARKSGLILAMRY